ncbi:hypothetical protein NIES2135_62020 (plasmid) [Leptolyngbya boryana NIES-2135]|jgi:hypothetical protein|uniref:Uncharacterized protein n=1 Tax=Leptolyngbya boryana NIES-2135 TaxID=1973484 RepID=A0A1Z4JRD1_LEPBY|nr:MULTISPECIES: hypothetical protein [Leptolyngbya]BAY59325.1 hypothetical protein NIES2135_62020 [Leptolyngbya boryana NIES-2135]MBD2372914.1 hypothetical protein [Leptolyngbya sp. FACHB-238]MBD2397333.1 hypothetical protein [Leptolyngbya sp. FACHB-239]MBD2403862.1 hypothetical protein [Leptolyngbya sp. FACHB-402]ULP33517.1 hypothetical protein MCP04_30785 [Leptolyngbya boryana IU 594]
MNLSFQALAVLTKEPEIFAEVTEANNQLPFAPDYQPTHIQIRFDDVPCLEVVDGVAAVLVNCPVNYKPPFTAFYFDHSLALFLINGEAIVDRTHAMANLDLQLNPT